VCVCLLPPPEAAQQCPAALTARLHFTPHLPLEALRLKWSLAVRHVHPDAERVLGERAQLRDCGQVAVLIVSGGAG
jgi:hypothetical protein